ncbi:MAG: hypothetical protein GIW94_05210 [Candidatus Eremiobacteraeota bacterium]|nr:hypothetical protein [Candidatus Eremiobacteraeota bacterium]MBC5821353.1 hypothetical protein [Candidatus Eremiobacteraeota bacterium]
MNEPQPQAIRLVEDRWATIRHVVEAVAIVAAGAWAFRRGAGAGSDRRDLTLGTRLAA